MNEPVVIGECTLYHDDCLNVLPTLRENSVDSVLTDPPYALTNRVIDWPACESCGRVIGGQDKLPLGAPCPKCGKPLVSKRAMVGAGFMGKDWDNGLVAFSVELWCEALRVAKPGAMLMAFGGDRTHHRLMLAIEDAGWEIRTCLYWVFGSGFPKSLSIGKAIDKAAGAEREVVGPNQWQHVMGSVPKDDTAKVYNRGQTDNRWDTAPATDLACTWDGYGTALKPAVEIIVLAMKPLDGTFAQNAEKWGVAGLWIDGGRILGESWGSRPAIRLTSKGKKGGGFGQTQWETLDGQHNEDKGLGRWPATLLHDGSEEVVGMFPESKSSANTTPPKDRVNRHVDGNYDYRSTVGHIDSGSAARFFYAAKASRSERTCNGKVDNRHPTVKPLALMEYLCKLTRTPTGGVVLDPFMGSGSTGLACIKTGRAFIGIEQDAENFETARQRIQETQAAASGPLFAEKT